MVMQWYVKELSLLTKVSVRTLHHYDKIGLLKPSIRLVNGYRVYCEEDLLTLQQILALKFFGFELNQIKELLQGNRDVFDHFEAQKHFLDQQIKSMQAASRTLERLLIERNSNKSVSWEHVMKLIEEYQMTKELKNDWVAKALDPEKIKEYASFEQGLEKRFTPTESEESRRAWLALIEEVRAHLDRDPASDWGMEKGKRCMEWVNNVFPKEYASLRMDLWEKGFKAGHTEVPPLVVDWLDKATKAYHRRCLLEILRQGKTDPQTAHKRWLHLLEEMYGDSIPPRKALYEAGLSDPEFTPYQNLLKQWRDDR